jgi:hypothetical protein
MKERPILFNGEMVRAILEGRKTETRRVVKGVKRNNCLFMARRLETHVLDAPERGLCPYGTPGDRLWVRETWCYATDSFAVTVGAGYRADGAVRLRGDLPLSTIPDGSTVFNGLSEDWPKNVRRWRPSIHMPRWASRIMLEVKSVHVERVQEITEEGAIAEGLKQSERTGGWLPGNCLAPEWAFRDLWDSINANRGRVKRYRDPEWRYWLWGRDEKDDPEAISLDIRDPGGIMWRDPTDPDCWLWRSFRDAPPPCDGYYEVMWEPGDDPRRVYLIRCEGDEGEDWDWVGGYGWESNPWVWVVKFEVIS